MTIALIAFLALIVTSDVLFRRVQNKLLFAALFVHTTWLIMHGSGFNGIDVRQSLIGGCIGFALFLPLYALRVMGAGDVKFFATIGFIMGTQYLFPIWLIGSVLAGAHVLIWYVSRTSVAMASDVWIRIRKNVTECSAYQTMLRKRAGRRGIPYAAYLAIGAIAIAIT